MRTPVVIIAAIVLSTSVIHPISACLIYDWSYQGLFDKSDFVVIAKPLTQTATRMDEARCKIFSRISSEL